MLLAVFSDAHGNQKAMRRAVETRRPDHVIFLGDGIRDAAAVERVFPEIPFILLRGNCDAGIPGYDDSILFTLDGVRIFAAHGHRHGVKLDLGGFYNSVCCSGSALGLYGHTHVPRIDSEDGVTLMNPGSVGGYPASYGLVHIEKGVFRCELVQEKRRLL